MTSLLTLDSLTAATPDHRTLFSGLTLSIGSERVGVVGRNGSGKSTLLRIAAGLAEPASGNVQRNGRFAMLLQEWPPAWSVAEALGVADGLAIVERILSGSGVADDLDAVDWTLEERIHDALARTGLVGMALDRPVATLSGGERARAGIARLFIEKPDLILLDEPTNNLDADFREAVYALVRDWNGGVLVASHDRALLEAVDRIVELTPAGIHVVGGGWSRFSALRDAERQAADVELQRAARALRDSRREAQRQREAKERRDRAGRAFAARRSEPKVLLDARAGRAEASGGRLNRMGGRRITEAAERLDEAAAGVEVLVPLSIDLPPSGLPSGALLLDVEEVTVALSERSLGPWTLSLRGPERVAVSGPNGSGKSTLLKLAAGLTVPSTGSVRRAEGRIALLDQHVSLLEPAESLLANHRRLNPSMSEGEAYAACARFAFRNRDARRLAGTLSGGERLRAGLACTLAGAVSPWLLILDEPTNHLDIESVELLESALQAYDGALLVASHDREFLAALKIVRELRVDGHRCGTSVAA